MSEAPLAVVLSGVFAGRAQPMPGDGRPTGIFKLPVDGVVQVTREGLVSDEQADRRVHGGPEKAVHQFAIANYVRLAGFFPEIAARFVPGAIGENLSAPGIDEADVCIGDVFEVGSVQLQLNQPRTPCWKIDAKFGVEGLTARVAYFGIAGWYYRVLREGQLQRGDTLRRVQRQPGALSVAAFNALAALHRPAPDALEQAAHLAGLNPDWQKRLLARAAWLRRAPKGPSGPIPD